MNYSSSHLVTATTREILAPTNSQHQYDNRLPILKELHAYKILMTSIYPRIKCNKWVI